MSISSLSTQRPSQYPQIHLVVPSSTQPSKAASTPVPKEDPLRRFLNGFPDEAVRSAISSKCALFKIKGNESVTSLLTKEIASNASDTLFHVQRLISIGAQKEFTFEMRLESNEYLEKSCTLPRFFLNFEDWSEMMGNIDPFQSGIEEDGEKERSFDALLSLGIYFYRKKSQEPRFMQWVKNNIGQRFFVGGVALAFANAIEDDELYNFFCQRIAPNCKDAVIEKAFYLSFLFDRETSVCGPKESVLCMQKIFGLSQTAISQDLLLRCLAENCQRIRSSEVARFLLSKITPNDLPSILERWPSAWESEGNPCFLEENTKNRHSLEENDLLFTLCKEFKISYEIIPVRVSSFKNKMPKKFALSCVKFLGPLNFEEGCDKARKEWVKQEIYRLIKFIYDKDKENLQELVNACSNPICPITASFFTSLSDPLFTFLALQETPELQEKFKKDVHLLVDRWWEKQASAYPRLPPSILKPTSTTAPWAKRNSLAPPLPSEVSKKRVKLANKEDDIPQITFSRNIPPPRDLTSSKNPPTNPFSSLKVTQLTPPPAEPQTEKAPLQAPLNPTADLASRPPFPYNHPIFPHEPSPSPTPPPVEHEIIFFSKGAIRTDILLRKYYESNTSLPGYRLDRLIATALFQKGKQGLESLPEKIKTLLPETTALAPLPKEETYNKKIDNIITALREESVKNIRSWKTDGDEERIAEILTRSILYAFKNNTPVEEDKRYIFSKLTFSLKDAIEKLPLNELDSNMRKDLIDAFANYIEQGGNNLNRPFLYILLHILPDEAPLSSTVNEKEPAPSPVINSIDSISSHPSLLQATALSNSYYFTNQIPKKLPAASTSTITFSRPALPKSNPSLIPPRSDPQTEPLFPPPPPVEYEIIFTSARQLLSDKALRKVYLEKIISPDERLDRLIAAALFQKGKQGLESLPEKIKTLLPETTALTPLPKEEPYNKKIDDIITALREESAKKIRSWDTDDTERVDYILIALKEAVLQKKHHIFTETVFYLGGADNIPQLKIDKCTFSMRKSLIDLCSSHIEEGGNSLNAAFLKALLEILPKEAPFDYSIREKKPPRSSVTTSIDLAPTQPSLLQASALPNSHSLSKQRAKPKPPGALTSTITFLRPAPPKKALPKKAPSKSNPPFTVVVTKPQPKIANPTPASSLTFSRPAPPKSVASSVNLMNRSQSVSTSPQSQPGQPLFPIFLTPAPPASTITFTKNTLIQKPSTASSSAEEASASSTITFSSTFSAPPSMPPIVIDDLPSTASSTLTFSNGTNAPHQNKTSTPTILIDDLPSTASSSDSSNEVPSYTIMETVRNGNCLVDAIALWLLGKGKRKMGAIPEEIGQHLPETGFIHPDNDSGSGFPRLFLRPILRDKGAEIIGSWEMNDEQTAAILASIHEATARDNGARGFFFPIQSTLKNLADIDLENYNSDDRQMIRNYYANYIKQDRTYLDSPFLSAISQLLGQGVQVVSINPRTNKSYFACRPEFSSENTITVFREEEFYRYPTGEQLVIQHYKGLKWNSA